MSIDFELTATHEAGHAVMQWLVDGNPGKIEIKINDEKRVIHGVCHNPPPDDHRPLSNIRKRLLVVFAAGYVTRIKWADSNHDRYDKIDWNNAGIALYLHFGRQPNPSPTDWKVFQDEESNQLSQEAREICKEIVNHDSFQLAIDEMVKRLLEIEPDNNNTIWVASSETVSICEKSIGKGFQEKNQWSSWIAGL